MTERKIIGTIELASKYRYGITSHGAPLFLFRPYDEAEPEYIVGSSERDLTRNQIAVVAVTTPAPLDETVNTLQTKPRGALVTLFGPVGDPAAERDALLTHYCPFKHPKEKEVEPLTIDTSDDDDRVEISEETGWLTFHIDPPGCRDIDDAIAYNPETKAWAITIADAAAAVPVGSWADLAASAIGSTFYDLEGRAVRPMLPAAISEDSASLLPGKQRRGLTLICAHDGSEDFVLSWIKVDHSFTYESFSASYLRSLLPLAGHDSLTCGTKDPHLWIEELMIRYNTATAKRLKQASAGLLRVQAAADAPAWSSVIPTLANEAARYEVAEATRPDQGHASLGLDAYCHASSPLRRYADLFNQRILKALLQDPTAPSMSLAYSTAAALNKRTKANRRWSRDLTFLSLVTPGRTHTIDVVFLGEERVWVPAWRRIIRLRHVEEREPGYTGQINIFCDPTKRNWTRRILTAAVTPS
jgi:exoribonuclease R